MFGSLFDIHMSLVALLLRLLIGGVYVIHGYPKFGAQQRALDSFNRCVWVDAKYPTESSEHLSGKSESNSVGVCR